MATFVSWGWHTEPPPRPAAARLVQPRIEPTRAASPPEELRPRPAPPPARPRFTRNFDATSFRRGNLHCHTNRSDGDSSPAEVYAWYRDHGYDFVSVTDHNTFTDPLHYPSSAADPRFLVLGGEEITMRGAGREVHVNALCSGRVVGGGTFRTASEALAHGVLEIRSAGGIALINHPNFTWGIKSADLPAAAGASLFEIHSGHPYVPSDGKPGSPSHEAMWDISLTAGLDVMGVAVDDAHRFRPDRRRVSRPGRAWVEVFADTLDAPTICSALENGLLYSSTGPSLRRISVADDTYAVWPTERNVEIVFVGSGGRVLATHRLGPDQTSVSYRLVGTEGYVRTRTVRSDGKVAWTPAVRVEPPDNVRTSANEAALHLGPPG